jgi:shikimate kinase
LSLPLISGINIAMAMANDDPVVNSILSRLDRPIVLVGMMGSGKSRIGRMLGEALRLPFADSDDEIEKAAGCSISDIFERYGEDFFRDRERKVILRLLEKGYGIIATGGGAVMQEDTAEAIWSQSVSIWVRAEMAVLLERVGRNSNRPLLKNGNPEEILSNLASVRDPVYEKADIVIDSHNGPAVAILNNTLQRLERFLIAKARKEAGR